MIGSDLLIIVLLINCISCSNIPDLSLNNVDLKELRELVAATPRKTPQEIVEGYGYPFESHFVTTKDGYILNLHRIPHGLKGQKNGKVAFLQHGILVSSTDWILFGPNRSLAYMLADEGYDVWMGNVRGNRYSRNHTSLDADKDAHYWQFSWHEMGVIDLPTMIDYVLEKTGVSSLYYSGHSQGTTVFFVMTSLLPEYNSKIRAQVSMAPIGFMNHMASPLLKIVSLMEPELEVLFGLIGMNEFLPSKGFLAQLSRAFCNGPFEILCENAAFAICGFSPHQMKLEDIPTILTYSPAGTSTRQMLHYSQEINSGHFRQYDFGLMENMNRYGHFSPPDYDLSKVTAPVYLIYSANDWLTGEKDVEKLHNDLAYSVKLECSDHSFNHLDFTYGKDAPLLVYPQIVSLFERH